MNGNGGEPKTATTLYEEAMFSLLKEKPFFARVIMSMQKIWTTDLPSLGVAVTSDGIKLVINPEFFTLNPEQVPKFLEHEVLHLLYNHTGTRLTALAKENKLIANYAADIAINQFIKDIPQTTTYRDSTDGSIKSSPTATLENAQLEMPSILPLMNVEYYYSLIKQQCPEMNVQCLDEHIEPEKSDLTEEQQQQLVKRTMKAIKDSCGSLTGMEQKFLDDLLKSEVDWKGQLRSFFSNAEEVVTESTRKKRNRRYGILYPGVKYEPKLRVAICEDSSGSVSDAEYSQFWAEIERIEKSCDVSLVVIEADCEIKNVFEYKRGMERKRTGYGGTAYAPALKKAEELGVDACIYFGDMDTADSPKRPRFPVLWAIVRGGEAPVPWGKVIRIPVGGEN